MQRLRDVFSCCSVSSCYRTLLDAKHTFAAEARRRPRRVNHNTCEVNVFQDPHDLVHVGKDVVHNSARNVPLASGWNDKNERRRFYSCVNDR